MESSETISESKHSTCLCDSYRTKDVPATAEVEQVPNDKLRDDFEGVYTEEDGVNDFDIPAYSTPQDPSQFRD